MHVVDQHVRPNPWKFPRTPRNVKGLVGCTLVLLAYFLGRKVRVSYINKEVGYGVLSAQTLRPTRDDRYIKSILFTTVFVLTFSVSGACPSVINWS